MRTLPLLLVVALLGCATTPKPASPEPPDPERDLAAARALFEKNLRAIQEKDREAYLGCYEASERLVRAGGEGVKLGFAELAEGTPVTGSDEWPSKLEASEVEVHWIAPGLVYGAYRYVVTIEGVTTTGLSERVLRKVGDRWVIAVTTAFEVPEKAAE